MTSTYIPRVFKNFTINNFIELSTAMIIDKKVHKKWGNNFERALHLPRQEALIKFIATRCSDKYFYCKFLITNFKLLIRLAWRI